MDIHSFYPLLVAAALGALIGIEREMAHASSAK